MTTTVAPDRIESLERKIDALTGQMTVLADEAHMRQVQREMYRELFADLSPVASDAMAVATRELEAIRRTADIGDVVSLLRKLIEVAPRLERMLGVVDALADLADDVMPLTTDMMAAVSDRLDAAHHKGYFAFAKAGLGVVDRVVAGFDEADVEALGDNVVTVLNTVKEITQPEMLVLLQRMIDVLQHQQRLVETEDAEPPSLWSLLRQVRNPDVRRGIGRALTTLGSVSVATGPQPLTHNHRITEQGDE